MKYVIAFVVFCLTLTSLTLLAQQYGGLAFGAQSTLTKKELSQRLQFKPGDLKLYADPNVITLTSDDKWDCHKLDPAGHAVFCKSGTSRIIWWKEPK